MALSHLQNHDNHLAIELSTEIATIAKPLNALGITYFNQIRIFNDLSRLSLGNHATWLQHFFDNKYYLQGRFSKNPEKFPQNQAMLWLLAPVDSVSVDARMNFNIDHGMTIIKRTDKYIDLFLFACDKQSSHMNEFLMANRDLLERFIAHYLGHADSLIKQCKPDTPVFIDKKPELILPDNKKEISVANFMQQVQPKKFVIYGKHKVQTITPVEFSVAQLYLQNKQPKEISSLLNIMPSTVYRHIENLRHKLDVATTDELIELLRNNYVD